MAHPHNIEARIPCEISGCHADFARIADMRRHVSEVHGSQKMCPEPGCDWRGAKRGERLEDHKSKAHPEIYSGVELNVPEGFGTPSPSILAQVPRPAGSTGGATMNAYSTFTEGTGLMASDSSNVLPGTLGETNELLAAQFELPVPQDQQPFQQSFPQYQLQQAIPGDVFPTNFHPPLIYPETEDPVESTIELLDSSGSQHQRSPDQNTQNEGRHGSWC